jgi:hypothetical protein
MMDDLANKRRFVNRAVYPYGPLACKELGIIPSSADVAELEDRSANAEMNGATMAWGRFLLQRAEWYVTAYNALHEAHPTIDGNDTERDLPAHLLAFAASLMLDERITE